MKITLRRLSNERHQLRIERRDGSHAERELETRSTLLHDLIHYALEAEAGIDDGFWGLLAAGTGFDDLAHGEASAAGAGARLAESLVGPLQTLWNGGLERERYVAIVRPAAPFVDGAFVDRVLERVRRLEGHWRGTPFHEAMHLTWPPAIRCAAPYRR